MDALDLENIDNGKEWEDDMVHYCTCGAEKNPDFPKCFMCGKKDRQDLDDWVAGLQYSAKKWDKEPF